VRCSLSVLRQEPCSVGDGSRVGAPGCVADRLGSVRQGDHDGGIPLGIIGEAVLAAERKAAASP